MARLNYREYYSNKQDFEKLDISVKGVEVFVNTKKNIAALFEGRKTKYNWAYSFKSSIDMIKYIDDAVKRIFDREEEKAKRKAKLKVLAKETRSTIKVGDIFATSWGYEQTNVSFHQITERISATRVKVRMIDFEVVKSTSWCSDEVTPIKDSFIGSEKVCTINQYGDISKADEYGHTAYKTSEDKSHHRSWGY